MQDRIDCKHSVGSSNYLAAIMQLAQTAVRSVIGKMELDKTFEERETSTSRSLRAADREIAAVMRVVVITGASDSIEGFSPICSA